MASNLNENILIELQDIEGVKVGTTTVNVVGVKITMENVIFPIKCILSNHRSYLLSNGKINIDGFAFNEKNNKIIIHSHLEKNEMSSEYLTHVTDVFRAVVSQANYMAVNSIYPMEYQYNVFIEGKDGFTLINKIDIPLGITSREDLLEFVKWMIASPSSFKSSSYKVRVLNQDGKHCGIMSNLIGIHVQLKQDVEFSRSLLLDIMNDIKYRHEREVHKLIDIGCDLRQLRQ